MLPQTKKEVQTARDRALVAVKDHNKQMKGFKIIYVPHPTQPKTMIEKRIPIEIKKKKQ